MDLLNLYTKSCCSVYVHFLGIALVFIRSPRWSRKVKYHYYNHSVYSHRQNRSFLGNFHVFQGYRGCLISRCVSSPHLSTAQLASAYTVSLCSDCSGEWLRPMSLLRLWLGVWGEGPLEGDGRSCCFLSLVSRCSKVFFSGP